MIHKCVGSVVFHIWPAICSLCTTLLTVTTLSVVWILRKRRSSILKSERPARTPFSEFEFNGATRTDTAKSRQVSFFRRTGLAEFVTNKATTTWKNPNEEHSNSLESSSNDSEANASRQPVGHLSKRIFDRQSEVVEAVDFISGLVNGSLNNVDFSQQLAPLECTADGKLTAPQTKFELSDFTEQSKLFGNDFTTPSIVDVNFPAIQQVEEDDLHEIEKDLERGPSNMGCHGSFSNGQNMSEYIEENLNTTHVVKNDEDMSITDTVHSPVHNVYKSTSKDKKDSLNNDWVADKENIAMNSHAPCLTLAPCETNFAVNEESNQVLAVDGKRLTLQPYIPEDSDTNKNHKTIVFESDEDNISMIQVLSSNILDEKTSERKTIVFDDGACNVSFNQALPANIILPDKQTQEKRRTIIYENETGNISVRQALPTNVILPIIEINPEGRRTVSYEDDTGNISVTQALPSNIILEKVQIDDKKQINEADDILTKQSLPTNITAKDYEISRQRTTVFTNETGNISITHAIPAQLTTGYSEEKPTDNLNTSRQPKQPETQNKKRTIGHGNGEGDITMTEAIPYNIIEKSKHERKPIVYDEDEANISMTLAISVNDYLLDKLDSAADIKNPEDIEEVKVTDYDVYEHDNLKPIEDALQENGKSTVFDANNLISEMTTTAEIPTVQSLSETEKRRTVTFDDDNCVISKTKPIPAEFITVQTTMLNKTETKLEVTAKNQASHPQLNVIVMQASTTNNNQPINLNMENAHDSKVELPIKLCNVDEVQVKSMASTTDQNIDKVFEDDDDALIQTGDEERKESLIISDEPSFDSDTEDKSLMAVLESIFSSGDILMDAADNNSTENRFYNTKHCEDVIQTDNLDSDEVKTEKDKKDELEQVYLQGKLAELQTCVSQNSDLSNEYVKQYDTQNLLDLISKWIIDSEDNVKPVAVKVKELGEATESKRLSVAPNRQSIALSREDLLSNISMAQAALQKSRQALDYSDCADEDTEDASVSKKSVRKSYENVKTINFDDESTSESSLKDEEKYTPLKKTVFGETSYMKETKGKVIPKHLKDVSDRIKELMLDFIKPVNDNIPFQSGLLDRGVLEKTSTHSTLVQANLTASSQVELISNAGVRLKSISTSASGTVDHPEKSKSRAFRNQVRFACLKETEMPEERHLHPHSYSPSEQPPPSEVLIFDHLNPLNNILLAPTNLTYVHKYNPRQTVEMFCGSRSRFNNMPNGNNYLVETVTTTQLTLVPGQSTKQENIYVYKKGDQFSQNESTSTTSGRSSVDESIEAISMHLRDGAVNTLIAMRENTELLRASSSLTLVDDLEGENSKLTSDNKDHSKHRIKLSRSPPVNIKGQTANIDTKAESLGISLRNKFESSNSRVKTTKGMKWIYSPSTNKHKHNSPSKEVTPKPITKIFRNPKTHKVPAKISSSASGTVDHPEKSKSRAFRNQVRFACLKETEMTEERHLHSHSYSPSEQPPPSDVLVFNHLNPLKNILLAPTNLTDVHKYNPRQTNEMLCGSRNRLNIISSSNNYLVETVTTTQCSLMPGQSTKQENIYEYQNGDQFSQNDVQFNLLSTSSTSGRTSVDDSVEAISKHLRDYEVNTLIAMRENTELLRASSSLTLVDDLEGENSKLTSDNKDHSKHRIKLSRSPPVNIKGQTADLDSIAELTGISLRDSFESSNLRVKTKKGVKMKRIYSPSTNKHKHYSLSKEVTPKLITKMQKISRSPKPHKVPVKMFPRNGSTLKTQSNNQKVQQSKKREKKLPKANNTKSGLTITVQQLITDFQNLEIELKHNNNSKKKLDDLNLNRTDSGVNVVAKIDMLAFMGSHECEWDSKSIADTWSFRLQHRRLRLTTRLAHRHHNATRTHVRGDTPVLDIAVEIVQHDRKNPLATLCVRFACETIRYMVSQRLRTPCCAKDIPQLLRRYAAVVRVALRWGRAMHDAKSQLAYTLDSDGNLFMKVADVRLRSVWEVAMRIDLVVDNTHSVPWPKASGVRVSRLVPELLVPDTDVRCDLSTMPRDWRHAPRTIW